MADIFLSENICIEDQISTGQKVIYSGILKKSIQKKNKCFCQKLRQKTKYKIQSPDESSNEGEDWEIEDRFDKKSEQRRSQQELLDLVNYASKLQYVIDMAKQQLQQLEETMQSNHAQL